MKTILKTKVGSHLYGTNTPTSDHDYAGIFIGDAKHYLGLSEVGEIDMGKVDKLDSGKNSPDAIDYKLYDIRKFFKLALQNNPNIMEILFASNPIECTEEWHIIHNARRLFISKLCVRTYLGYAESQRHKMVIRGDKFHELEGFIEKFQGKKGLIIDYASELKTEGDFFSVGDMKINRADTINAAVDKVKRRFDVFGNRKDLISKHGYDCKFASHLIRLLLECIEILTKGDLTFPLKDADMIIDIKSGGWSIQQVEEYAIFLIKQIEWLEKISKVRDLPDTGAAEHIMIGMIHTFITKN